MADVKELVDRVRSKLTDEQLSDVGSDLEQIKSGYLEKVGEWKAVTAESIERKGKIRNMTEELENVTIERDSWKTKFESHDDSELIQERDAYKEKWSNYITTKKDSFVEWIDTVKETEPWGKVKNEYVIPEENDWDKLKPEDIEKNVTRMEYHQTLGLFENVTKPDPKPPTNKPFEFSNQKVPTTEEINQIMEQHGWNSDEFRRAKLIVDKHKRGEI
jgi:hypothetical protein